MQKIDLQPVAAGARPGWQATRRGAAQATETLAEWAGKPGSLVLFGLVCAILLISRQPSAILHAEFWGDDGWLWYPEAYNNALASFVTPRAGYLQTVARLGALMTQPFPLAWAPTIFALIALFIQCLAPVFLVSSRMADAWPNPWGRLACALILVGLPNSFEVFVKLTDSQWQLAILTFLVTVSRPPASRSGRIFDALVLLIGGLSGPFCLMLLPVAAWHYWQTRSRTAAWRFGVLAAAACAQALCIALTIHSRSAAPLGASVPVFARIFGLNIVLSVFLGQQRLQGVLASPLWSSGNAMPLLVTGCGLALIGCGLWYGSGLVRKACLFAALNFTAALVIPQVTVTGQQWQIMTFTGWGDRYYVFPMLAFIGVLFALSGARPLLMRIVGWAGLAVVVCVGVAGDWVYPEMPPTDFLRRASAFSQAGSGTIVKLPMHPTGTEMWLEKK